jgi:hypothetical protein
VEGEFHVRMAFKEIDERSITSLTHFFENPFGCVDWLMIVDTRDEGNSRLHSPRVYQPTGSVSSREDCERPYLTCWSRPPR